MIRRDSLPPPLPEQPPHPGGWPTPTAASLIGLSYSQLLHLFQTGRVTPYRDKTGVLWWSRDHLDTARRIVAARTGRKRGRKPTKVVTA